MRRLLSLGLLAVLAVTAGQFSSRAQDKAAGSGKAVELFNGKDLTGWAVSPRHKDRKSHWVAGHAEMDPTSTNDLQLLEKAPANDPPQLINAKGGGVDLYSEQKFGDCRIEVELMVPKGANSGIYVMGEYEIQVLDSFGRDKVGAGDLGGLYGASAPKVNAAKKPGEWQKFVIDFQAPRYEGDKKISNAKFIKITLNDTLIHENVEMKGPTPSGVTGKEAPTGPIMFQGDHGPVAYRNIRVTPK